MFTAGINYETSRVLTDVDLVRQIFILSNLFVQDDICFIENISTNPTIKIEFLKILISLTGELFFYVHHQHLKVSLLYYQVSRVYGQSI